MEFEEVKARMLERYGDAALHSVLLYIPYLAKQAEREVTEEELATMHMCSFLIEAVRSQMYHLATVCGEPIPNPATMSETEENELTDDIAFGGRDEQVAARVNLVKLHKPIPPHLKAEALDDYLDDQRDVFVSFFHLTVREAFDYFEYWEEERRISGVMHSFVDEWVGYQGIAEAVGDEVPKTMGEYFDYRQRLAEAAAEEEKGD